MSAEQIVEWSQKGIEFGGHTSKHPELPLESDERIEQEIAQCKEELTKLLGKPPLCFAYPFGSLNMTAVAAVSRHFQLGFTTSPGRLHLASNPYLVPRIAFPPGESKLGMWCRLRLGRNPFEAVRNRWRRWTGARSFRKAKPI
jgi:peptidoglycan/xylan/chitin deacetylase (PgdA/CDA1 family)